MTLSKKSAAHPVSSNADYLVRPARVTDARALAEVHDSSWRSAYDRIVPGLRPQSASLQEREQRARLWIERSEAGTKVLLVAEIAGEVVGFCGAGPCEREDGDPRKVAEIAALYLVESAWGLGIGSTLQVQMLEELKERGFEAAVLWVLEENARARRFYESRGWKRDARRDSFRSFGVAAWRYRRGLATL